MQYRTLKQIIMMDDKIVKTIIRVQKKGWRDRWWRDIPEQVEIDHIKDLEELRHYK